MELVTLLATGKQYQRTVEILNRLKLKHHSVCRGDVETEINIATTLKHELVSLLCEKFAAVGVTVEEISSKQNSEMRIMSNPVTSEDIALAVNVGIEAPVPSRPVSVGRYEPELNPASTRVPLVQLGNPKRHDDFKIVCHFGATVSRRLRRPATATEIKSAWYEDKLMIMFGDPERWQSALERVAHYVAKTWRDAPEA